MSDKPLANWLPTKVETAEGQTRKIGVEIELAGVPPEAMANCIHELYGGEIRELTPLEFKVENSDFGNFKLELDASYLKDLAEKQTDNDSGEESLAPASLELITKAAEQLVPWEVVAPPIKLTEFARLERLVSELRGLGALGTRNAPHYAFGVHLNPELPELGADTILRYLRAYFCLYDWIVEREQVDTARRLTTYIKHFDKPYIERVLNANYSPPRHQLIDDYLAHNPTRNRSLDLLPLFAHLDEPRVRNVVNDPRIKPRPTFHYRLPNCDIDNPDWNLSFPWRLWLEVEKLANQKDKLEQMRHEYQQELARLTHPIERRWASRVADWVAEE